MRDRTYGGVRGRKTKVGRKLLRFPPTRFRFRAAVGLLQWLLYEIDFLIVRYKSKMKWTDQLHIRTGKYGK